MSAEGLEAARQRAVDVFRNPDSDETDITAALLDLEAEAAGDSCARCSLPADDCMHEEGFEGSTNHAYQSYADRIAELETVDECSQCEHPHVHHVTRYEGGPMDCSDCAAKYETRGWRCTFKSWKDELVEVATENAQLAEANDRTEDRIAELEAALLWVKAAIEQGNPRERNDMTQHRLNGVVAMIYAEVVQTLEHSRSQLEQHHDD